MLEVRLIGKFDIQCDGKPVRISSRVAQSLFAYLILTAGTSHRREKLAGMFWPDKSEEKARAYLRHELWRIRQAFPPPGKADYLVADDINISFDASSEYWLDVAPLENVSESASIDELKTALSVFQGELLPSFYEDWITGEREHLQTVFEQRIANLLEMLEKEQRWDDILEWAERWISFGQAPEAAFRYLMIAYDGLGDRAKITSTYERCVQALRALELEPSEQTRALAFKGASKLNIPIPLTSFIGREKELKEIAGLISKSRLVTLTGSGGVGKTRLAIQVVADVLEKFPDGVWFLDLAPLSDPALVPTTLANLLGLRESGELLITDLLINYFRSRTALVIFDNCEHLIESCAQLINSLLTSCEGLSILATSREALRVSGEISYRVPSLEIPNLDIEFAIDELSNMESVRLFAERAALASTGFAINEQNALIAAQICQRLDGIPLAIELAAARSNMLTVVQILKRLDDRFKLLTGGSRAALPRHQTLRAMIEWSYHLLSEKERVLFRRLAVFVGGWTLETVEEVCARDAIASSEVLELLSQLVNKSLVIAEKSQNNSRYRMLETIRQYANERLLESGETALLRERHLNYFLRLAEEAELKLRGAEQIAWLNRLKVDHDNLRTALAWSVSNNTEAGLRLVGAMWWFWRVCGYVSEGFGWMSKMLALPESLHRIELRAKVLHGAAFLESIRYDDAKARTLYEQSLALYTDLGDQLGIANALNGLGFVARRQEDWKTAPHLFKKALKIGYELGNKYVIAAALEGLGIMAFRQCHWQEACNFFEKFLAIERELKNATQIAIALLRLGSVAFNQGDIAVARERYEESLSLYRELNFKQFIATLLNSLGEVARYQGDFEKASNLYSESLSLFQEQGVGFENNQVMVQINMGYVMFHQGHQAQARELFQESLLLCQKLEDEESSALCLIGIAGILASQRRLQKAVSLISAAQTVFHTWEVIPSPANQAEYEHNLEVTQIQLDRTAFEAAWVEGGKMSLDEARDLALKTVEEM